MKMPRCFAIALCLLAAPPAAAHCDSLDGPVVRDARTALERKDIAPVLKWVREQDEAQIREAFARALAARALGAVAREVADPFFFETLVRVHRAGEGEPFTGLKRAGSIDPGIARADSALEAGTGAELSKEMGAQVEKDIRRRYAEVMERRARANSSTAAGREYVEAYVEYIHFVETLQQLGAHGAGHAHPAAAD